MPACPRNLRDSQLKEHVSGTHFLNMLPHYDFLSSRYVIDGEDHKFLDSDTATSGIFTLFNAERIKACHVIITPINASVITIKSLLTMPLGTLYDHREVWKLS